MTNTDLGSKENVAKKKKHSYIFLQFTFLHSSMVKKTDKQN